MNTLWYKTPAADWSEALPVGNGRLGAMVYGRPEHEVIQLNEESVWSAPYRDRNNRSCRGHLEEVRELLRQGHEQEARELAYETMTGTPPRHAVYQAAGELHLDFYTADSRDFSGYSVYRRELDLETAVAATSFSMESDTPSTAYLSRNTRGSSISYTREVFVSADTDVLVVHAASSTPKGVYLRAGFDRGNAAGAFFTMEDDTIAMQCTGGIPFCAMATAVASSGTVCTRGNFLIVEGADEATLYVDVQTAFRKLRYARKGGNVGRSPASLATWCADEALRKLCFAASGSYQDTRNAHIAEYSQWYNRVQLSLAPDAPEAALPTAELLAAHPGSPALEELRWNYSRYLLISCSRRPGTLPATPQGLWNRDLDPQDGGGYAIDGTMQAQYEAAAPCGLDEAELPLFSLLRRACRRGSRTARVMYGCDGYVAHGSLDLWGDTAPLGTERPGWVLGAAWLALGVREHYEYTLSHRFLRKHYYLLKEACDFFADYLVRAEDGTHLVLPPGLPPEQGSDERLAGRVLRQLFRATLQSAKDLGMGDSEAEVVKLRSVAEKLGQPGAEDDGGEYAAPDGAASDGVLPNLLCAAPRRQVYGNLRMLADVAGAVVRSRLEHGRAEITLLPALPARWQQGALRGIAIKGNLRMDVAWQDGKLASAQVYALPGTQSVRGVAVIYRGRRYDAPLTDGRLDIKNVLPTTV